MNRGIINRRVSPVFLLVEETGRGETSLMHMSYTGTIAGLLIELRKRALGEMIDSTEVSELRVYNKLHGGQVISVAEGTYREEDDIALIEQEKEKFNLMEEKMEQEALEDKI